MKRLAAVLILTVAMSVVVRPAAAEVFLLTSGRRVVGELLNKDESPRRKFVVRTTSGEQITLDASQVKQVLHTRPGELEYETIRSGYPDTVEGQWKLAEWCRERRLVKQRKRHLGRIIELDPDHAEARRALGYLQENGRWVTREQLMAQRGYKYYKGRYRTVQEIELLEQKRKINTAEKEWFAKLKRWRRWLGSEKDLQGRKNIKAVNDPMAVKALADALKKDDNPAARILYTEVLAQIGTTEAVKALAECSIEDPVEEVRLTCMDHLEQINSHEVTAYYVGKLRDKKNRVVNLSAVALGRMKDPSAVGPLIDALVTTHKLKTSKPGGSGSTTTTFGTGPGGSGAPGGGGMSMGGGPKIYTLRFRNQKVLDALVAITGRNFNFDRRAWKYWYAAQKKTHAIDARRD